MSSSTGQLFRIATWGESHGGGVGVVIDGCLPQLELTEADIQKELDRRRPGQSDIVTPRKEADRCEILSGVFQGKTLGTPVAILVRNEDARPEAYSEMESAFRPSHADFTYEAKYGIRNWQGGGRASARETIGRVAAGVVARKVLDALHPGIEVLAWVSRVHQIESQVDPASVTAEAVEANAVRCPDPVAAEKMIARIKEARSKGDSVGGLIACLGRQCPPGRGDPVFDTLGGVQGGISNGEDITFRVAFKPTATIASAQQTVTASGENTELAARGRHDPCVIPRAVPIVEAMVWLVLADHALRQRAQRAV